MSSVSGPLVTDMAALGELKARAAARPDDNLREVARQFESLFTHMLMKNMRAASFGPGIMDSEQSKFYQDMFDQQMSTELAAGKGLGIADLLLRQLGGASDDEVAADRERVLTMPLRRPHPTRPVETVTPVVQADDSPAGFVSRLAPHAARVGHVLGIAPRFLLAQAALETGWGRRPIAHGDGSSSHNLFGIKAGGRWKGPTAVVATLEHVNGLAQKQMASFRAYASEAESFDDYATLLRSATRYRGALHQGENGHAFASALQNAGYATDPDYASKILQIADGKTMRAALRTIKFP